MTGSLLQRVAGTLVSQPWFYELVQNAARRSIVVEEDEVLPNLSPAFSRWTTIGEFVLMWKE